MGLITSVRCQEANIKKTENTVSPNIILILADDMGWAYLKRLCNHIIATAYLTPSKKGFNKSILD